MTINYHYDADLAIIRTEVVGTLDLDEFRRYLEDISSASQFPSTTPALVDMTAVDMSTASRKLGEHLASLRRRFPQRADARVAFVAKDDLAFGMSRMYQIISDDIPEHRARVFRDQQEALDWLQQP